MRISDWSSDVCSSDLVLNNSNAELLQGYRIADRNSIEGNGFDAAFNYQLGFRNHKNKLLTFSYRYFSYVDKQHNHLAISTEINYPFPDHRQSTHGKAAEQTFQMDYIRPGNKLHIDAGAKAFIRSNTRRLQNTKKTT